MEKQGTHPFIIRTPSSTSNSRSFLSGSEENIFSMESRPFDSGLLVPAIHATAQRCRLLVYQTNLGHFRRERSGQLYMQASRNDVVNLHMNARMGP